MEESLKERKEEEICQVVHFTDEEIIEILKTQFHDFEKIVGRKMTYAEERDYGEARDFCG